MQEPNFLQWKLVLFKSLRKGKRRKKIVLCSFIYLFKVKVDSLYKILSNFLVFYCSFPNFSLNQSESTVINKNQKLFLLFCLYLFNKCRLKKVFVLLWIKLYRKIYNGNWSKKINIYFGLRFGLANAINDY